MALVMIVVAVVLIDKPHFGSLVGRNFLAFIISGIFVGALVLLVAAWNLQERRTWRGIVLIVWALIALTSPGFGYLFLGPWAVLALSLPLVIFILVGAYRHA
jgi:hypothetical protein